MVPSALDKSQGFFPYKSSLQPRGPSSCTRNGWIRLSPIVQYSLLLPPVGVGSVSQYPCGGPRSHAPYPSLDLVSRYLTNYLMGRTPIFKRRSFNHLIRSITNIYGVLIPVSQGYPLLKVGCVRVTHPFAGRQLEQAPVTPRLACIKPPASVHPEPGSNSP